jgi:WD40 repeat protein
MCDWGDDGRIYLIVGGAGEIMRVKDTGGKLETVLSPDTRNGELVFAFPRLLPAGGQLLFNILTPKGLIDRQLALLDLETHEKKILLEGASLVGYARTGPGASTGYIVYFRDGSLFAVPFDLHRLQVGPSVPLLSGVAGVANVGLASISDSGTLAYITGGLFDLLMSNMVWVDRRGNEQVLPVSARSYQPGMLVLSPDGGRAAASIVSLQTVTSDLWIHEVTGAGVKRLTFGGFDLSPVWTPDSKHIIYWFSPTTGGITPGELRSVTADNSGPPTTILASPEPISPTSVSPDGKLLLATKRERGNNPLAGGVWVVPLESSGATPRAFLQSDKFDYGSASFSPDGHWVAYNSNDSGKNEVYVVPFPEPGGKTQVSFEGGTAPRWNRNGRELFYLNGSKLMAVDVFTSPTFHTGTTQMLFELQYAPAAFDASPDGKRFLITKPGEAPQQSNEVHVVVNWFEELRQRAR